MYRTRICECVCDMFDNTIRPENNKRLYAFSFCWCLRFFFRSLFIRFVSSNLKYIQLEKKNQANNIECIERVVDCLSRCNKFFSTRLSADYSSIYCWKCFWTWRKINILSFFFLSSKTLLWEFYNEKLMFICVFFTVWKCFEIVIDSCGLIENISIFFLPNSLKNIEIFFLIEKTDLIFFNWNENISEKTFDFQAKHNFQKKLFILIDLSIFTVNFLEKVWNFHAS